MKRTILALAIAVVSVAAYAAPPPGGGAQPPLNVNVTNSVLPVEVSNADPIPVQAVGSSDVPFTHTFTVSATECSCTNCCFVSTPAVPAGKRLVIQSVSGHVALSAAGNLGPVTLENVVGATGTTIAVLRPVARTAWNGGDYSAYDFNDSVLAFVDAGNTCRLSIFGGANWSSLNSGRVVISGYLVNAP